MCFDYPSLIKLNDSRKPNAFLFRFIVHIAVLLLLAIYIFQLNIFIYYFCFSPIAKVRD